MDVGVVQSAGSLWHKEKDSADQYCDRHRLLCYFRPVQHILEIRGLGRSGAHP